MTQFRKFWVVGLSFLILVSMLPIYAWGAPPSKDASPPTAPANLTSSNITSNSAVLAWNASTDNVGVTGYNIYVGSGQVGSTTGTTTYTATGLVSNTSYSFTVKAKDAAGNLSPASNTVVVTTSPIVGPTYNIVGYYTSWSTYRRNYQVTAIDGSKLTHINYAFADICWNGIHGNPDPTGPNPKTWTCQDEKGNNINPPNGTVVIGDVFADATNSFPGDVFNQPLKGNFNQLNKLKQQYPHLKTLISVGGWSWSNRFSDVAADLAARTAFAKSTVDFIRKYGFDGVDLDWEYPVGGGLAGNSVRPEDKHNYTLLLQATRAELDAAGQADGKQYLLTIAAGASGSFINHTEPAAIAQNVNWINLMTYDFHGGYEPFSGHNAPLYYDPNDTISVDPVTNNVDGAVTLYLNAGVNPNKMILGVPFYGKGWDGCTNVNNGQYQSCSGPSRAGTWEGGTFDFSDLQAKYINLNGYTRYFNNTTKTPFLYNASRNTFISYDDDISMKYKMDYLKSKGLAGGMFWELSADRNKTLLNLISTELPR